MARPFGRHLLNNKQKGIVEENINFIWFFYRKYLSNKIRYLDDTDKEELVSELYFGLCLAAEGYDPKKGEFSTIATLHLRSRVGSFFSGKNNFNNSFLLYPFIVDEDINSDFYSNMGFGGEGYKKITKGGDIKDSENYINEFEDKEYVSYLLENSLLTEREKNIIQYYYLDELNLLDILKLLNVGRHYFNECKRKALKKIKESHGNLEEKYDKAI